MMNEKKEEEEMKKNYESPKAEKVEFNYTDAVVASDIPTGPSNSGYHTEWRTKSSPQCGIWFCHKYSYEVWVANCN